MNISCSSSSSVPWGSRQALRKASSNSPSSSLGSIGEMRRSYAYKVKMSRSAIRKAEWQLALCCELYNSALEQRREWWKRRQSVSYFDQSAEMPGLKELRPEFRAISSNVLLNVLKRVDW